MLIGEIALIIKPLNQFTQYVFILITRGFRKIRLIIIALIQLRGVAKNERD